MNTTLQTVSRERHAPGVREQDAPVPPLIVSRTFDAKREPVWRAWTERSRLMQWFGPAGFTMPAAKMDLRPGGMFHYCLCAPNGDEAWGRFVFREIAAPERLVLISSFSDEDGGITGHPSVANWPLEVESRMTLREAEAGTVMTLELRPFNAAPEEARTFDAARDGMKQGWAGMLDRLKVYLADH